MVYWKGTEVYNIKNPRNYKNGGLIYGKQNMSKRQLTHDSVIGILKPGEIVIPTHYKGKPLVGKIIKMLKTNNIYLPHMK